MLADASWFYDLPMLMRYAGYVLSVGVLIFGPLAIFGLLYKLWDS